MKENEAIRTAKQLRFDKPEDAIVILTDFLRTHPESVRSMLLLASIYADDYGEGPLGAERLYRSVLELDPDNVIALCGLAKISGQPGSAVRREEGLSVLRRAFDLTGDPILLWNLANKAWDEGRFDDALSAFDQLRAVAGSANKDHLVRLAEESLELIRHGKRPQANFYEWPEVD